MKNLWDLMGTIHICILENMKNTPSSKFVKIITKFPPIFFTLYCRLAYAAR